MKIATLLICFVNVTFCFQLKTAGPRKCKSEVFATKERRREFIDLKGSKAPLLSRTVEVTSDLALTVWEWEEPAEVVESYWEAEQNQLGAVRGTSKILDPFGIVSWPGSLVAARELSFSKDTAVKDRNVLILGAGVGLEAQAAALSGARHVLATDIHPTTLRQLQLGVEQEDAIDDKSIVETRILDLFAHEDQPLPDCDLLVVADVLYNENLASQVVRRIVEAYKRNPKILVLVTDSQRFVLTFDTQLNELMEDIRGPLCSWTEEQMTFTGSGVIMNEDQTYDVTVRKMWIGA
ncbi:unnamed protein product [Cylindrotheca closterium]|uniref:ETFB lysine methyltransferase n=1 Tax=Cylindrotheca closterium TaxID=2856 RepID=A0AAD2FQX0_9STRA|nr:unnamed protein product [Cylindrotheca closterium]